MSISAFVVVHCESKNCTHFVSSVTLSNKDFNDSFTVVTINYLHTNVEFNLPHHLNYVACKTHSAHRACETV